MATAVPNAVTPLVTLQSPLHHCAYFVAVALAITPIWLLLSKSFISLLRSLMLIVMFQMHWFCLLFHHCQLIVVKQKRLFGLLGCCALTDALPLSLHHDACCCHFATMMLCHHAVLLPALCCCSCSH